MSIIKSVRNFIKTCPYLNVGTDGKVYLGVDYLKSDTTTYSLEEVPVNPVIKWYVDGSSIRQATFIFCSREPYGPELQQLLQNSGFYEDFVEWLEKCTHKKELPMLSNDKKALSIEALTSGYAFATDSNNAQYQIQINFKYYQERVI